MKTYVIYQIRNTINGKLYIGQTENSTRRRRTHNNKSHNQHLENAKHKMSKAKKGKPSHRKGAVTSEETKRKISEANKGRPSKYKGRTRSVEIGAKISAAKRKPIAIGGIEYECVLDAMDKLGLSRYKVNQLLRNR